ncbi:unnamed protein product, partial [Rotaria sordida]
ASNELRTNALSSVRYAEFCLPSCHYGYNKANHIGKDLVPFLSRYMPHLQTLRLWRPDDFLFTTMVTLWYLKHYHSERYIASELNLNRSTVNYFLSEVVNILHACVYPELISIPADIGNRRTPHEPQQHHKLIVDSTCIAIPEPHEAEQRRAYYHGKSPTNYAFKVQVACDFHHQIVHVSDCYHGSVHDITILRESGLLEHVNDSVQIIGDKGYIGEEYVVTPRKKPHGRELTNEDKEFNYQINSARAAIENINQRLKTYGILGGVYRGDIDDFHKMTRITKVVSALCNMNLNKHPVPRHVIVFEQDLCQLIKELKEFTFLDIYGEIHYEKVKAYRSMVQTRFPHSRVDVEISRFRLWL